MNGKRQPGSTNPVNLDPELRSGDLRPSFSEATQHYDFVLAGGGLSGLSLAYHLAHSPLGTHSVLAEKSILIVDQSPKSQNDRTWGFWSDRPTPFDHLIDRSWARLRFVTPGLERISDLGSYRYHVIRGIDFYDFVHDDLARFDNITFRRGRVKQIADGHDEALVTIDDQLVGAKWVFDSCSGRVANKPDMKRYQRLKLHFVGWEIRTETDTFDEYTIFSDGVLPAADYAWALHTYIGQQLGIEKLKIVRREHGCIPITDQPFPRRLGRRVMRIGAKAGRIKPTTGYAFSRIQADSAAIVDSLLRTGEPFDVPADAYRYRLCDSILLEIMEQRGRQILPIFETMFGRNSLERILRFLDEATSPWEHLAIIPTLPPLPFLRALSRRRGRRRRWIGAVIK
jgi:lycopene beta-cyclase